MFCSAAAISQNVVGQNIAALDDPSSTPDPAQLRAFIGQQVGGIDCKPITGEITYGYIPPYSVVVSGSLPSKDGTHSLYCAVIVKQVDAKTRSKTSVNDLLRGLAD